MTEMEKNTGQGQCIDCGQNFGSSLPRLLRKKLKSPQKIDLSQIKQYYDISSQNASFQILPSNPIGPKKINKQAQKPACCESSFTNSMIKAEMTDTPEILKNVKRVSFTESHTSQNFQEQEVHQINQLDCIRKNLMGNEDQFLDEPIQLESSPLKLPIMENVNENEQNHIKISFQSEIGAPHSRESICSQPSMFVSSLLGPTQPSLGLSTNQSLCDEQILAEIRNWEDKFEIDKNILEKVGDTFKEMEGRISDLEAQFEICYNLTGKMEAKYQDLHLLLRGAHVYKVSRQNKRKAHLRIFFYSPGLEAFCWKSPKENFPEKKQLVYLNQIREIRTTLDPKRKLPAPFTEQQYLRIIMIDQSQSDLEIICQHTSLRTVLLKVFNSLLEEIRKSKIILQTNTQSDNIAPPLLNEPLSKEFLVAKYSKDIDDIKEQISSTKHIFGDSTHLLRKAFFQATSSLVQKEKSKRKVLNSLLKNVINYLSRQRFVRELQY